MKESEIYKIIAHMDAQFIKQTNHSYTHGGRKIKVVLCNELCYEALIEYHALFKHPWLGTYMTAPVQIDNTLSENEIKVVHED